MLVKKRNISKGIVSIVLGFVMLFMTACQSNTTETEENESEPKQVKIMASGDMLFHQGLYESAWTGNGYDFTRAFAEVKPLISTADIAIGDFEGAIATDQPASGYPVFNTPKEVVPAIKDTGYDVVTLAQNHILDMGLAGAIETKQYFEDVGIQTIGFKDSAEDPIVIKEVNGIKIALLAYTYAFNGQEVSLTEAEQAAHLLDLDQEKIVADLKQAEELADVTVVLPHMGTEYVTEQNSEQEELFQLMIANGADIIFGGHPHVPQPTQTVMQDGQKKFIIYSMGNLLSNMTLETMGDIWTERGVVMEVNIEKTDDQTTIQSISAHPTVTVRDGQGPQTVVASDYLAGGNREGTRETATEQRIQTAYAETLSLLNLDTNLTE